MIAGKTPLAKLYDFVARRWFTYEIDRLAHEVATQYNLRNEVLEGGIVTAGGAPKAADWQTDVTALRSLLHGRLKADIALINDGDLRTDNGIGIGKAIFVDGDDASALTPNPHVNPEALWCALIVTNSKDDGGVVDTDNGAPLLVLVIKGTAATYASQTDYPTSVEIKDALAASTAHAGVTGWAHVAQLKLTVAIDHPDHTITFATINANRNNVLGA